MVTLLSAEPGTASMSWPCSVALSAASNSGAEPYFRSGGISIVDLPIPQSTTSAHGAWWQGEDGTQIALCITDAGLRAIGVDQATGPQEPQRDEAAQPSEPEREIPTAGQGDSPAASEPRAPHDSGEAREAAVAPPVAAGGATRRASGLRDAAASVLTAWNAEGRAGLDAAVDALRAASTNRTPAPRETGAPRKPREGTKQEAVLALLRRPDGASGPAIAEATGWAPHTVRGFLAGLAKKGMRVEVLDRVRQVGPGREGAKGSYSIYRIAEAG